VQDTVESVELTENGKPEKRSIGVIVLGVGREPENLSKKLAKRLKDHPKFGDEKYRSHKVRCGGPADFQGDEKDIIVAMLPSKVLLNNISLSRWEQAINVAMSRAKERFHLFYQLRREDVKCVDNDPRRMLIEYCEQTSQTYKAKGSASAVDSVEGFAREVKDDLQAAGIEVRSCEEILSSDWKDKMLVVEGARRMVAVVLNGGERQTVDLWRVESQKWTVLSRVDWRIVECWRFQYIRDRDAFVSGLTKILFEEEGVRRPEKLTVPGFTPDGTKPYAGEVSVKINAEPGATVWYSVDGTRPIVRYEVPIVCPMGETRIKAFASKRGHADSDEIEGLFKVIGRAEKPVITPEDEGPYTESLRMSITSRAEGTVVWYTTDGSTPDCHSLRVRGAEEFELCCEAGRRIIHVRAIAVSEEGTLADSEEVYRKYVLLPAACEPVFASPTCPHRPDMAYVKIACKTPGAAIRYKTNMGSKEITPWASYNAKTGVLVDCSGIVITAIAEAAGYAESRAVSSAPVLVRACKPTFDPNGGVMLKSNDVYLSCDTEGVIIRYRVEGPNKSTEWAVYEGPVFLTATDCVIRAVAYKDDLEDSEESVSQRFTVKTRPPCFEPSGGSFEDQALVTIRCGKHRPEDSGKAAHRSTQESKTTIHCTTDGSPPEIAPALFKDGNVITVMQDGAILRACAVEPGLERSDEARSAVFEIRASCPHFDPDGGEFEEPTVVRILHSRESECGLVIRYTLDGSMPTQLSAIYDAPVMVKASGTIVRAVAFCKTKQQSSVAESQSFCIRASPDLAPPASSVMVAHMKTTERSSVFPDTRISPIPAASPGFCSAPERGAAKDWPDKDGTGPRSPKRPRVDYIGHPTSAKHQEETQTQASNHDTMEDFRNEPSQRQECWDVGATQICSFGSQDQARSSLNDTVEVMTAELPPTGTVGHAVADSNTATASRPDRGGILVSPGQTLDPLGAVVLRYHRAPGEQIAEPGEWVMGEVKDEFTIGRSLGCDLTVHDTLTFVSRQHCKIRREGNRVALHSEGKKAVIVVGHDGTNEAVEQGKVLQRGLRCGDTIALLRRPDGGLGHRITVAQLRTLPPEFEPDGGEHDSPLSVTIQCGAPSATIHYTVDGTPATRGSACYHGPVPIRVGMARLRAVAVADGMLTSDEAISLEYRFASTHLSTSSTVHAACVLAPKARFKSYE
jgi:pSer/pThr/pTyr-binding forkhead associated (FHA) protein